MTVLVMMKGRRCVDISVLRNPRHEQFAQLVATGNPPAEAYVWVGFSKAGAAPSATRLLRNAPVRARVEELQHGVAQAAATRAAIDREYVLAGLKENYRRAMQQEPVLDSKGRPTGEYTYHGSVANRALELMGKELGMFVERHETAVVWDGNPKTLTNLQLDNMIEHFMKVAGYDTPEKVAAARQKALSQTLDAEFTATTVDVAFAPATTKEPTASEPMVSGFEHPPSPPRGGTVVMPPQAEFHTAERQDSNSFNVGDAPVQKVTTGPWLPLWTKLAPKINDDPTTFHEEMARLAPGFRPTQAFWRLSLEAQAAALDERFPLGIR